MARRVPLSSIDAAWLGMEDPTNLMMVTGVMALDVRVDIKRLRGIHRGRAVGIAWVRAVLSLPDETAQARPPRTPGKTAAPASRFPLEWLPSAVRRGVAAGQDLLTKPEKAVGLARVGAPGAYRLG